MIAYTAIYGGYDQLNPHPDTDVIDEWICYTDDPDLRCDGWDVIVKPVDVSHPRMQAKWWKCHPPAADRSIWIDGCINVTNPCYFTVVADLLEVGDLVLFPHPQRTSIIAEAAVSEQMLKYADLPVSRQAHHYISDWGWTDHELWASTTLGRNHTPNVLQLGAAWFAECEHWTYQDQISLPPLVHRYDVDAIPLPHSLWANPWFHLTGHASAL
jgi:hypothetical protein